jgi:hypothetical protein
MGFLDLHSLLFHIYDCLIGPVGQEDPLLLIRTGTLPTAESIIRYL